ANTPRKAVYASTAPATTAPVNYTHDQMLKYGTKVGAVDVKAPKDPNLTADVDEPADEVDAPEGTGLDQGALAHVAEQLSAAVLKPTDVPKDPQAPNQPAPAADDDTPRPLLGPTGAVATRTYAAVGISTRGRKGPVSRRTVVPLVPPPPPPGRPAIAYDETAITVTWPPIDAPAASKADEVLPSRTIGVTRPAIA